MSGTDKVRMFGDPTQVRFAEEIIKLIDEYIEESETSEFPIETRTSFIRVAVNEKLRRAGMLNKIIRDRYELERYSIKRGVE